MGPLDRVQVDDIITQRLTAAVPTIIAQLKADELQHQDEEEEEGERQEDSRDNATGCTYKAFMACKPKEFHGTKGTIKTLHWIDEVEAVVDISDCVEKDKVRFVTHSLKSEALEWCNTIVQTRGCREANKITWSEFVKMLTEKYYPINELEKLQTEFLSLSMEGKDVQG